MRNRKRGMMLRMLAVLMTLVLVIGTIPASAASKKSTTVKTKTGIKAALENTNITKVTYKTSGKSKLTINPVDGSENKELVIDAPNAPVVNKAKFKKVTILNAKSYKEACDGNIIVIKDSDAKVTVTSGKDVDKIVVSAEAADITIGKKAKVSEIECKYTSAEVAITASKKAEADITLSKKTNLKVSGAASADVDINAKAKKSSITASVPVEIETAKSISVILEEGSEGSVIDSAKNAKVSLDNQTKEDPVIKVEGEEVKEEDTPETTPTPAPSSTPTPIPTTQP